MESKQEGEGGAEESSLTKTYAEMSRTALHMLNQMY